VASGGRHGCFAEKGQRSRLTLWNTAGVTDAEESPRIIRFSNPIDASAPPVTANVDVVMLPTVDGGLKQPLQLPSPSLVFRIPEQEKVVGYTVMLEHDTAASVEPGGALSARARFVGVPSDEVWIGRTFALWHGRDVGTATVRSLIAE
jgi:hypothetical protein